MPPANKPQSISALCVFLVSLLSACSLAPERSETKIYILDIAADAATVKADRHGNRVLMVAKPRAEAGFDTARIAYTRSPLALGYYSKSQWSDAPARMLIPLLTATLERTAAFRAVVSQPTSVIADLLLDVHLVRLQHEFFRQPSQVSLSLRANLVRTANGSVVASRLFEAVADAPSEDAYGGVQAANQALREVLTDLSAFVVEQGS